MRKQLSIETVHVEICVVRVDGHKMTLATFRQIPEIDYLQARKTHNFLGWVSAAAPWPNDCYVEKEFGKLNQNGIWILCVSPEGTLHKAAWQNLENAPGGKQLYMAT